MERLEDRLAPGTTVGSQVWHDLDADGIQDALEPGFHGAVVELFQSTNTTIGDADDVSLGLVMADNGTYQFSDVPIGVNLYLHFRLPVASPPVEFAYTVANQGSDDALDSDADPATGRTALFSLAADENNASFDVGLINISASINDAPSFTKGPNITVPRGSGPFVHSYWATEISAGPGQDSGWFLHLVPPVLGPGGFWYEWVWSPNPNPQTVAFEITSNSNPGLFAAGPTIDTDGTLTFTPAAGAIGSALITVRLKDNGGTANGGIDTSAEQSFTITVPPRAPRFTYRRFQ